MPWLTAARAVGTAATLLLRPSGACIPSSGPKLPVPLALQAGVGATIRDHRGKALTLDR